jgi:hypothetical protein
VLEEECALAGITSLATFRNVRPYLCPFASFANFCRDILHLANPNALIEIQAVGVIA